MTDKRKPIPDPLLDRSYLESGQLSIYANEPRYVIPEGPTEEETREAMKDVYKVKLAPAEEPKKSDKPTFHDMMEEEAERQAKEVFDY